MNENCSGSEDLIYGSFLNFSYRVRGISALSRVQIREIFEFAALTGLCLARKFMRSKALNILSRGGAAW